MKDVQDNNVVSRMTKPTPVTASDSREIDYLVHEHEVNFRLILTQNNEM